MKIFNQFKSGKHIQKLRSSRELTPEALNEAKEQLIQMGDGAIKPAMEALSHGEARVHAMEILQRLINDENLSQYLDALTSPNPAIATGVTKVLSTAKGYDASRLVELLSDSNLPKTSLETILWEQAESLSPRRLVGLAQELTKDARAVVFRLLEKLADENTVPQLVPLADNEDWWVRLYVAKLLGEFDNPASIKALSKLLGDKNKGVRLESVASVHRIKSKDSIPALVERLRDGDIKVQTAAIDALIDICDSKSVPHLLDVLKDESEYARRGAVEVLNEVATTDAIQDLVRALRDADWWVRVRAADALGTLGGPKVVDGVVGLLKDEDDFIRRYAVEILNAIPSERAVEPLIKALQDDDWWVRERSIDALAKTGDRRAVEPLMTLMHQDAAAVPHCVRALGVLGFTEALKRLGELAGSENDEIRCEAIDALVLFSKKDLTPEDRKLVSEALAQAPVDSKESDRPSRAREMEVFGPEQSRPSLAGAPMPVTPQKITAAGADPSTHEAAEPTPDGAKSAEQTNFYKLPAGTVLLNRFKVIRQIGKGGFGSIYLVEDNAIREEIILKILNPQLSMDETAAQRFVRELKLSRSITHENVIRLYDFLDLGGARAVSMEYFESRDLGRVIYHDGAVDFRRTVNMMIEVCHGLSAAHTEGIIHRDVKPANILVGDEDRIKIVDFGLAAMEQQAESRLTKSGLLIGTPEYMAPEQVTGTEVDHRSDIYSLGLVMYEMLSSKKPFVAETPVKVLFLHLEGEAEPLSSLVDGIPQVLENLVARCMSKEPDDRPQDCDELLNELESIRITLDEAA